MKPDWPRTTEPRRTFLTRVVAGVGILLGTSLEGCGGDSIITQEQWGRLSGPEKTKALNAQVKQMAETLASDIFHDANASSNWTDPTGQKGWDTSTGQPLPGKQQPATFIIHAPNPKVGAGRYQIDMVADFQGNSYSNVTSVSILELASPKGPTFFHNAVTQVDGNWTIDLTVPVKPQRPGQPIETITRTTTPVTRAPSRQASFQPFWRRCKRKLRKSIALPHSRSPCRYARIIRCLIYKVPQANTPTLPFVVWHFRPENTM